MPLTLQDKLRIKKGMKILPLNAPSSFDLIVKSWPENPGIATKNSDYQQIHWFVKNKAEVDKEVNKVIKLLKDDIICWIYYPKGSSKIQTDLTRDKGWESLLNHSELQWLTLISFDETWSAFGMRLKTNDNKKRDDKSSGHRPIFDYVDPVTKKVTLPDDVALVLRKHKKANAFFESLSFTNKKEYIEWIITAKKEDTRKERIEATMERLLKNWKNPRNL